MLEFAAGAVFGAVVAGIAARSVVAKMQANLQGAQAREGRATEAAIAAQERTFRLLAANQSQAIRRAVGADSTEDIERQDEEDRRFRLSFLSSD